jgi:hypothetical protein
MATGAIVARILTQYSNKGSKAAQKDIALLSKSFDAFGRKSAKAFGIAAAASAAFAIKLGKDAVQGAMEDQKQQIALATALRNTTGATDEAIAATVTYLDKLELLVGVDNNQLIPSLQILTQATKDVTVAQQLQGLALDISAGSTKDLGTVSLALAKAIGGNIGALTKLGVPLDKNAVKAKDLEAILASLASTFKGQAEKRAETLEFRLMKLQLAFNQILDKLGYALIPVLEKFAAVVTTKILPAINKFVETNQDKLVASFTLAANAAVLLLTASINFANWIANNMGLVKAMGILIAGMFVATKVYAMITAVNLLTAALVRMNIAMGAGLIGPITKAAAKGGALATLGVVLAGGGVANKLGAKLAELTPGTTAYKQKAAAKAQDKIFGNNNPKSPSPSDILSGKFATGSTPSIGGTDALAAFLAALNANTAATKKNTKTVFDIATENAMKELAARQKALSGSASIAIGGGGKIYSTRNNAGKIDVNVYAGNVVGSADALIELVQTGVASAQRRSGGDFVGGRNIGNLIV